MDGDVNAGRFAGPARIRKIEEMKVTVERTALAKLLGRVQRVVERKTTIPLLSHFLLEANGGRLYATGTDMDVEVIANVEAEIAAEGATTVSAHLLHELVRKLPDGAQVTLDDSKTGNEMVVRSGRSRFTLSVLSARDFPTMGPTAFTWRFDMPAKSLKFLFDQTQNCISQEEVRYYLNGVYMHVAEGGGQEWLTAVATDGHRLARAQIGAPEGASRMEGIIVPKKTVVEVLKLIEDPESPVSVEMSASKVRFTLGDVVMTSKLIDQQYPDYDRVIPKGNDKVMVSSVEALRRAVDRVSTIASERGRQVKLSFAPDLLTVSVSNPDAGTAEEEIEVDYKDTPMEIGFNAKYLLEILGLIAGDRVAISLNETQNPAIVRDPTTEDVIFVLMPMRV
jgi:DNA polymerase-3 subunit beta